MAKKPHPFPQTQSKIYNLFIILLNMCSNESARDNLHKLKAEVPQASNIATVF